MLSEGQRNDINYAIPLLEQVDIKESDILAEKGLNLTVTVTGIFTKKDI